jgi:hypothetical protein
VSRLFFALRRATEKSYNNMRRHLTETRRIKWHSRSTFNPTQLRKSHGTPMDSKKDNSYVEPSQFSAVSGFADLAATPVPSGALARAADDVGAGIDEFGRWLELQSLRFRGKLITA